jgi:hypothetical protein
MSIHEHLPAPVKRELKQVGWTKGLELAKLARRNGQEFDCATWLHKGRDLPKEEFRREVEKELTGKDTEPSEIMYFKLYKSQIPVVEQAQYTELQRAILQRDGWRCQVCGTRSYLEVHHQQFHSRSGSDTEENLITLCHDCHSAEHGG